MELKDDYILNELNVFLAGEYGEFGERYTRVINGKETFLVKKSPLELIEDALSRAGSNLQGVLQKSKNLPGPMGNILLV